MVTFERREHSRKPCDLPILFCMEETGEEFQHARLFNISVTGLSFETHGFIESGARIRVKLETTESDPDAFACLLAADKVYQAVVRWCTRLKTDTETNYLVGVMLTQPLTLP